VAVDVEGAAEVAMIGDAPYLVWGRVVPEIPDFYRELVVALAER